MAALRSPRVPHLAQEACYRPISHVPPSAGRAEQPLGTGGGSDALALYAAAWMMEPFVDEARASELLDVLRVEADAAAAAVPAAAATTTVV